MRRTPTDPPATLEGLRDQGVAITARIDTIARSVAALAADVSALREAVGILSRALLDVPAPASRPRVKLSPAQKASDNKRRTYKARVARAAKRYGFTVEEWIERFGEVDRLPPGQRRPTKMLPQ